MMRSCNPLHRRPRALRKLPVKCPLVQRFPEVLTGKLTWYKDCSVPLSEVIDCDGPKVDVHKMWRLMVWIWLGSGGYLHQAWNCLKGTPCTKLFMKDDKRQPMEVLRFVVHAVQLTGGLMRVIGGDGLDKKSRLSHGRFLYLAEWHEAVPKLVQAFGEGAEAFDEALHSVRGLRGELTRKEVCILFAASRYSAIRAVGGPILPFGQGAKNGAKAFLRIPQKSGAGATAHYQKRLSRLIPKMEAALDRLFPALPREDRRVTLGDIEPCLCAAFVYAGLVVDLRRLRGIQDRARQQGRHRGTCKYVIKDNEEESLWKTMKKLRIPAGFYAYTREGKPEASEAGFQVPNLHYADFQLARLPPKEFLHRKHLFRLWSPTVASHPAKRRRRKG